MKNESELRKYQDEKNMELRKIKRTHEVRMAIEQRKITDITYDYQEFERKNRHDQDIEQRKLDAEGDLLRIQTEREKEKVRRQLEEENLKEERMR